MEYVQLPPHLANLDYLGDYYGSIWGTVREIYSQHVGWFDGDPLNLHRPTPREQSERMAKLAGGFDGLMRQSRAALAENDAVWSAQLAQHAMRLRPDAKEPKLLLAGALDVIGEKTFNAPARNSRWPMPPGCGGKPKSVNGGGWRWPIPLGDLTTWVVLHTPTEGRVWRDGSLRGGNVWHGDC